MGRGALGEGEGGPLTVCVKGAAKGAKALRRSQCASFDIMEFGCRGRSAGGLGGDSLGRGKRTRAPGLARTPGPKARTCRRREGVGSPVR